MVTTQDINEKRLELELLEQEYLSITPPCKNVDCSFYKSGVSGNCTWSVLLEECRDYET